MTKVEKLNKFVDDYFRSYVNVDAVYLKYRESCHYYAKSATTSRHKLWSYDALIACIALDGRKLFLNSKRYSMTTSRLQNALRKFAKKYGVEIVECNDIKEVEAKWWDWWRAWKKTKNNTETKTQA